MAAVDHAFGRGKTRLIGTAVGHGYRAADAPAFFAGLLAWGGKRQHARISDSRVTARLHDGPGGTYLWLTNPTMVECHVDVEIGEHWGPFARGEALWGEQQPIVNGRSVAVVIAARDAAILRLG